MRGVELRGHAFEHSFRQPDDFMWQPNKVLCRCTLLALDSREELLKIQEKNIDTVLELPRLPQDHVHHQCRVKRAVPRHPAVVVLTRPPDHPVKRQSFDAFEHKFERLIHQSDFPPFP